jgi:hypothetical protein
MNDLVADFAFAQEFRLTLHHQGRRRGVVKNSAGRAVAVVPIGLGGVVRTRGDRWNIQVERRKLTWAIVAHTIPGRVEAGGIAEGFLPGSHKLWIAPDTVYRVTKNPLDGSWSIKDGHAPLARLTNVTQFTSTITTLESSVSAAPLPLAILLTLELIKAEASLPRVPAGAPAFY